MEHFCGGGPGMDFAGPVINLVGLSVEDFLCEGIKPSFLGNVTPDATIEVFITASLRRGVGVAKIGRDPDQVSESVMVGELGSLIRLD